MNPGLDPASIVGSSTTLLYRLSHIFTIMAVTGCLVFVAALNGFSFIDFSKHTLLDLTEQIAFCNRVT